MYVDEVISTFDRAKTNVTLQAQEVTRDLLIARSVNVPRLLAGQTTGPINHGLTIVTHVFELAIESEVVKNDLEVWISIRCRYLLNSPSHDN